MFNETSYLEWTNNMEDKSCVQWDFIPWVDKHMEDKSCVQRDLTIWVDKHMEDNFCVQRYFILWVNKHIEDETSSVSLLVPNLSWHFNLVNLQWLCNILLHRLVMMCPQRLFRHIITLAGVQVSILSINCFKQWIKPIMFDETYTLYGLPYCHRARASVSLCACDIGSTPLRRERSIWNFQNIMLWKIFGART
jgi:hypothetical protein